MKQFYSFCRQQTSGLLVGLLLFSQTLSAQTTNWAWSRIGTENVNFPMFKGLGKGDSSFIVADMYDIKSYDKGGNVLWSHPLDPTGLSYFWRGNLFDFQDTGFAAAYGNGINTGYTPELRFYNPDGTLRRTQRISSALSGADYFKGFKRSDGGFVLVGDVRGQTVDLDNVPRYTKRTPQYSYPLYAYFIQPNGGRNAAILDAQALAIGGSAMDDFGNLYIAVSFADDTLTINGQHHRMTYTQGGSTVPMIHFSIIKFGPDGRLLWFTGKDDFAPTQHYQFRLTPQELALSPDGQNLYVGASVSGYYKYGDSTLVGDTLLWVSQHLSPNPSNYTPTGIVMRLDSSGRLQRSYTVHTDPTVQRSNSRSVISQIVPVSSNRIIVAGTFSGFPHLFAEPCYQLDAHLAVMQLDGQSLARVDAPLLAGGPYGTRRDLLHLLHDPATGAAVVVAGVGDASMVPPSQTAIGFGSHVITSTNSLCTYFAGIEGLPSSERQGNTALVKRKQQRAGVYPNPAQERIKIQRPSGTGVQSLVISDLAGMQVLVQQLTSASESVSVAMLKPGLYMVRVGMEPPIRLAIER